MHLPFRKRPCSDAFLVYHYMSYRAFFIYFMHVYNKDVLVQLIIFIYEFTIKMYSRGPMFLDCQNFAGSCGRNFVGNWLVSLQCLAIHYFNKRLQGHKFVGKGTERNPRTLNPTNSDDSTVLTSNITRPVEQRCSHSM